MHTNRWMNSKTVCVVPIVGIWFKVLIKIKAMNFALGLRATKMFFCFVCLLKLGCNIDIPLLIGICIGVTCPVYLLPIYLTSLVRYEARFACYRFKKHEKTNISSYCRLLLCRFCIV